MTLSLQSVHSSLLNVFPALSYKDDNTTEKDERNSGKLCKLNAKYYLWKTEILKTKMQSGPRDGAKG